MSEDTISLRDYIESRFKAIDTRFEVQDKALSTALVAVKEALSIKDRGDRDALELARKTQAYKDEKANELREQLGKEREDYATKADLAAMSSAVQSLQKVLWMAMGAMLVIQLFIGAVFTMLKERTIGH